MRALMTRTPTLPEEPRPAPSSRLGGPSESTGSADFLDPFGHVREATLARTLHVEASSVIADPRGDAPLVAVKLDHHRMSRGMLGNVLQRLHAAEVQSELHIG